jgi:hypothetical protein
MTQNNSQNFKRWYVLIAAANIIYVIIFYLLMRLFS